MENKVNQEHGRSVWLTKKQMAIILRNLPNGSPDLDKIGRKLYKTIQVIDKKGKR